MRPLVHVEYAEIVHAVRSFETQREAALALGICEKTLFNKLCEYRKRGWPTR